MKSLSAYQTAAIAAINSELAAKNRRERVVISGSMGGGKTYEQKSKADALALDLTPAGDTVMTHDGRRWIVQNDRSLVQDLRSRKQRRRDSAKARK